MRIIDKAFPKCSKTGFTDYLKKSTPLTEEQKKQDYKYFVNNQNSEVNQDFND